MSAGTQAKTATYPAWANKRGQINITDMSAYLEQKLAELSEEIRTYPGPIARCDQHLPALLEERARLMAELARESCPPQARWGHDGGRMNEEKE